MVTMASRAPSTAAARAAERRRSRSRSMPASAVTAGVVSRIIANPRNSASWIVSGWSPRVKRSSANARLSAALATPDPRPPA